MKRGLRGGGCLLRLLKRLGRVEDLLLGLGEVVLVHGHPALVAHPHPLVAHALVHRHALVTHAFITHPLIHWHALVAHPLIHRHALVAHPLIHWHALIAHALIHRHPLITHPLVHRHALIHRHALVAHHAGLHVGGLLEFVERLLLVLDGLREVALLQRLRGHVRGLRGVRQVLVRGLLGDLLLKLGDVRHPLLHALVAHHGVHRHALVARHRVDGHLGHLRLIGGVLGLLDGLRQLLRGLLRIDLVRLERGLVGGLLALLLVDLLLHVLRGVVELGRGVLGLFATHHRHVHGEVVLRALLLHAGLVHLLGRVGCDVFQLLAHVLGRRGEVVLLLGDVAGVRLLRVGGGLVGGLGHVLLVLREFLQLALQVFELGDLGAPLLDGLGLLLQFVLGLLQRRERVLLLGLGVGGLLGVELVGGLLLGIERLVERLLGVGVRRERGLGEVVGLLRHVLLGGGGLLRLFRRGVLGRLVGLRVRVLLVLDDLVQLLDGLLGGGERVGLGEFGRGDLAVEFVLRALQPVERLLLRLPRPGLVPGAEFVLGLLLLFLGRGELLGGLRGDLQGGLAGVAGRELGLGLLVGELVGAGGLRIDARLGLLGRVGPLGGVLVHLGLGVDGLLHLRLGGLEGVEPARRGRAERRGQVLQFLRVAALRHAGLQEAGAAERIGGGGHVGGQLDAARERVGLLDAGQLLRGEELLGREAAHLLEHGDDLGAEVALLVREFLTVVHDHAAAAR